MRPTGASAAQTSTNCMFMMPLSANIRITKLQHTIMMAATAVMAVPRRCFSFLPSRKYDKRRRECVKDKLSPFFTVICVSQIN